MQVPRLGDLPASSDERRRRPRFGAERRDHLVRLHRVGGHQLRPGALLGAELAQPQLAAVGQPDEHPGCAVAQRGTLVEDLEPACRHQMDQHRERSGAVAGGRELDDGHLGDAANAGDGAAAIASSGGSTDFSATMPGASADSTSAPSSAALKRRAVISTSGSSGIT